MCMRVYTPEKPNELAYPCGARAGFVRACGGSRTMLTSNTGL